MRKFFLLLIGTLFFVMGHIEAQDKPLVRYDEEVFLKVANKVKQKDYPTPISFAEKAFKNYFDYKGVKVDFNEDDYKTAIHAHDTCAASFKKLLKEKNRLADAKQVAEDNYEKEKKHADSLQKANNNLNKQMKEMPFKNDSIRKLIAERDTLQSQQKILTDANQTLTNDKNSLIQEKQNLSKSIEAKADSISILIAERNALQQDKDDLTAQIQTLTENNARLQNAQKRFEEVFNAAETQINSIYEANRNKSCADMKDDDLQKALDAYKGIASLIQFRSMSPNTQNEVNQITAWSDLKRTMEEAVKYMEGKYNNKTRTTCLANLGKITSLSGKQLEEKEEVLQALKDQETVNTKFNELLNYLKNDFVVIASKKDAQIALNLIDGKTITNPTKQIVVNPNAVYHKKHLEALRELHDIMANAASNGPKKNLQLEADFQIVIENVRSKYQ